MGLLAVEGAGMMIEAKASIRILSLTESPERVSEILNLSPSLVAHKGDLISLHVPNSPQRSHSLWILESSLPQTVSLEEHIAHLCGVLVAARADVEQIRSQCDVFELFCMMSPTGDQGSVKLSAASLALLAQLRVDVVLDVYAAGTSEGSKMEAD
ncbi:MAG: hypothetical protein JWR15_1484 [Prosthecobacter sp.]|nr:hypothetical protein [Prosthecobacter sp.]